MNFQTIAGNNSHGAARITSPAPSAIAPQYGRTVRASLQNVRELSLSPISLMPPILSARHYLFASPHPQIVILSVFAKDLASNDKVRFFVDTLL